LVLTGWHPEHEDAPGGGSAATAVLAIPKTSGNTLTRLAALSTLSRSAGERGPSPEGWVGEGGRLTPA
jgi:hypothetical protein